MRDYVNDGKPLIVMIKSPTYFSTAVDTVPGAVGAVEQSGWLDTGVSNISPIYHAVDSSACLKGIYGVFGSALSLQQVSTQRVTATIEFRGVR